MHVAARHVAACSSILQPDMLPPVWACCSQIYMPPVQVSCSQTCCYIFKHVAAWDMLPAVRAYCSLIRTCCSRERIFSRLFWTWYGKSICSSGLWEAKMHKCMNLYKKILLLSPTYVKFFGLTSIGHKILALSLSAFKTLKHCLWQHLNLFFRNVLHHSTKSTNWRLSGRNHKKVHNFLLVTKSPTHTGMIYVKTPEPNISSLGLFKGRW